VLGTLDVAPLRSFVAVDDCGGFQRAANTLHLSQAAVSQHVRRLEAAVGRPLVERQGRGSRFTADGEQLLLHARRILAAHDEALRSFAVQPDRTLVVGSTEHAAAQLLPDLATSLADAMPQCRMRFRVDRGAQLRQGLDEGRVDLALLLGSSHDSLVPTVGRLALTWYAAPGWSPPSGGPIPVVAFDEPCALRDRALDTLASHGLPAEVTCEASHLAGVYAAVRAGLGVGLMATLGHCPDGLAPCDHLPVPPPLDLSVWSRRGLPREITDVAAASLRQLLATGPGDLRAGHTLVVAS
jgi:DNA-binding transcriptional LysR family regulator